MCIQSDFTATVFALCLPVHEDTISIDTVPIALKNQLKNLLSMCICQSIEDSVLQDFAELPSGTNNNHTLDNISETKCPL